VSWVLAENLHFTLRFFGDLKDREVETAIAATVEGVRALAPFDVALGGLGAFPNPRHPSVWWVGVREGAEALEGLAGSLDRAYRIHGLGRADKPFRPHLTLGRVRRLPPGGGRPPELTFPPLAFRVLTVEVIASLLSPRGARYTSLHAARLEGDAAEPHIP
jgi:2'-5' RNA ligase